jgi:transcription antitermination factor NusG
MYLTEDNPEIQPRADAWHWHALYTRHQHEKTIARLLANTGHEVFLPIYTAQRGLPGRLRQSRLPLFPCYVFIRGGMDRRLQLVTTPGVFAIVSLAGKPAIIPHEQIEAVRRMVDGPAPVEPYPHLACGDRVKVKSGPLTGLEGTLLRIKNSLRLVVSFEMLGRSAAVEIDTSCLETPGPVGLPAISRRLSSYG